MKIEVDPQELKIFNDKMNSYVSEMEYLLHATTKHIDDMAMASRDGAIAGVATDIKGACRDIEEQLQGLKTGPMKTLGQKTRKYTNVPDKYTKGRSR